MIRKTVLFLLLPLLLLSACTNADEFQNPVSFYYLSKNPVYGEENGLICPEQREGAQADPLQLLELYLQSPSTQELINPFPNGTRLLSMEKQGPQIILTMSEQYGSISGMELSLANACLAKTVFGLMDCQSVTIKCNVSLLNGEAEITLTQESLLLFDDSVEGPTETTPTTQ